MTKVNGFNNNEYSFSNNNVVKLYDILSVVDFSMDLIKQQGRHEFQAVIMQQLRMIYTDGNDIYGKNSPNFKKLNGQKNSFSLFDFIANNHITDSVNNELAIKDALIFPKLDLKRREYEDLLKEYRFYYYTNKSILDEKALTFQEFLDQVIIEVEDAGGNILNKNVKQCIKILANKAQGAHYQVHISKIELAVISQLDIISQTLGMVTLNVLMPICKAILKGEGFEKYMQREEFVGLSVYKATPL